MVGDVKLPVILRTGRSSFRIFVSKMKSSPNTAVCFAVAEESNLFGRHLWNPERIEQKNQLAMFLSGDEGGEISGALRGIEIGQRAQILIVAKLSSQQLLVLPIEVGRLCGLWSAGPAFCICGGFYFIESLVRKSKHQM